MRRQATKIQFLGGVGTVTGSRFLAETAAGRFLVDCGLYQERNLRERNWEPFPVPPESIRAVVLTHAHLDHCGYLPKLVKDGFRGPVFCTHPTRELLGLALADAGKVQEEDAAAKRRRHERAGISGPYPEVPLYTEQEGRQVLSQVVSYSYGEPFLPVDDVEAVFRDAGHILGSAVVELSFGAKAGARRLVCSGDIGRYGNPLLRDPSPVADADVLFIESTYGNRLHNEPADSSEALARVINETCRAGGRVVVPTFAIERAQELLYHLGILTAEGLIPQVPVFIDSPLAIDVTEVYLKFPSYLDPGIGELLAEHGRVFRFPLLKTTRSVSESKAIRATEGPAVILAGSGMCVGGRIKHHLADTISSPQHTILFVGYQAEGTLGREILERPREVRILGQVYPVRARIEKINGYSAHADRDELLRWVKGFGKGPGAVFVIHGEQEPAESFAALLTEKLDVPARVPQYLDEVTV